MQGLPLGIMDSESHIHSPSVFLYKLLYFQELLSTLLTPPVLVIKHYTHKQKDKEFAFKEQKKLLLLNYITVTPFLVYHK